MRTLLITVCACLIVLLMLAFGQGEPGRSKHLTSPPGWGQC